MHPNGYTKEDIRKILGTSCPEIPEDYATGNEDELNIESEYPPL